MDIDFSMNKVTGTKYASIIFCNVVRSFSRYKSVLRPNRRNLNFENLKHSWFAIVLLCNN